MTKTDDKASLDKLLRRAAARATESPQFMAHLLASWGETEGLSWSEAAELLGCRGIAVARLALCHRPNPTPDNFREQVSQIAQHAEIEPDGLARFVRTADAIVGLRNTRSADLGNSASGLLLAALDRLDGNGPKDPDDGEDNG